MAAEIPNNIYVTVIIVVSLVIYLIWLKAMNIRESHILESHKTETLIKWLKSQDIEYKIVDLEDGYSQMDIYISSEHCIQNLLKDEDKYTFYTVKYVKDVAERVNEEKAKKLNDIINKFKESQTK